MDHVDFHREPSVNVTTMVVAFGGWINAGGAATGALRYLIRHLSASKYASIDPEHFFDFTQERPYVRMQDEGQITLRWPRSDFYVWQPEDQDGLLLYYGREPHQKWRTFTKTLLDVAEQCGVKRIVSLGAFLAGAPHTRPTRVTGRSTDPEWKALLEEWGIYRRPSYEGPTGISTVVTNAAARRGISHLSFMGQSPHYLQGTENPAVKQALLTYANRLLDVGLEPSRLDAAVKIFRSQCDQAIAQDTEIQAHVRQLEEDDDATDREETTPLRDEEINSDQLMQELEEFLREERGSGEGSSEDGLT